MDFYDDSDQRWYDAWRGQREPEPWEPGHAREPERLTHLVLLDGRLLDTWTEQVAGSRWQRHVDALERREHERLEVLLDGLLEARRPALPPPPDWERALAWLADRCGGEEPLLALDEEPLTTAPPLPDELALPAAADRPAAVAALLDAVAAGRPEPELGVALHTALALVCRVQPQLLTGSRTPAQVAGGITWAVLKANGVLRPVGEVRVSWIQDALALRSSPGSCGALVRGALVAFRPRTQETWRPPGVPDLLDLGRAELLTSATRRTLVQVRDRALEAREAASGSRSAAPPRTAVG